MLKMRLVNLNQIRPNRGVRITPQQIEILFAKRQRGEITERQMVEWADMVEINDAYYWEPEDTVVGKWVNVLSLDLRPEG